MARVSLTPDPNWPVGHVRVEVDGNDISRAVRAVDVRFEAGQLPRVVLDLAAIDVSPLGTNEAQVMIGEDVRDALLKLGWTPPEEK